MEAKPVGKAISIRDLDPDVHQVLSSLGRQKHGSMERACRIALKRFAAYLERDAKKGKIEPEEDWL